ncbi:MAG: flavin reductase [Treponema sp.]|nr:flavin reductase [Treponema sp.]
MDITTLFKLSSGLYIIGTKDNEKNAGCVVNTVVQTTAKPVTLSVCIHKDNFTNACIKKTGEFAVSILSENIKENIIGAFGFSSSRDKNKFSDVLHGFTPSGMPYLKEGVTGFIQCKVIDSAENFTHTIFIAEVNEAENILNEQGSNEKPMTYEYYHRVIKGKAPKNASSYTEDTQTAEKINSSFKCSICGYEFPGSIEEFKKLPDEYKCPICTVAKNLFKPV